VLKLADQLTPAEQDKLVDELKLAGLRRAIAEGEESIRQYGTRDAEDVFSKVISELERRKAAQ
jgi:hypothetical protein